MFLAVSGCFVLAVLEKKTFFAFKNTPGSVGEVFSGEAVSALRSRVDRWLKWLEEAFLFGRALDSFPFSKRLLFGLVSFLVQKKKSTKRCGKERLTLSHSQVILLDLLRFSGQASHLFRFDSWYDLEAVSKQFESRSMVLWLVYDGRLLMKSFDEQGMMYVLILRPLKSEISQLMG